MFEYHRPETVEQARDLLVRYGGHAKVLAGGQSLVPMMHMRLVRPAALVDINRIPGLDRIERVPGEAGDVVRIGATVRHADVLADATVRRFLPIMHQAVASVGHPAIRNRGTSVGSVCHADPAAETPAVLVLLDGEVEVFGAGGHYTLPAESFFVSYYTTAMTPEDVAVALRLPLPAPGTGQAFAEVSRRSGDFALVGAGACVRAGADGRVAEARLVFFGVGGRPERAYGVEAELVGVRPTEATWTEAGQVAALALEPDDDLHATAAYRREVAAVLAARVLSQAWNHSLQLLAQDAGEEGSDGRFGHP